MRSVLKVFAEAKSLQSRLAALAKPLAAESVHTPEARIPPINSNLTVNIFLCHAPVAQKRGKPLAISVTYRVAIFGKRLDKRNHEGVEYAQPVALFTEDAILKIRTMKPPGTPQISITSASLEQVLAAAGNV